MHARLLTLLAMVMCAAMPVQARVITGNFTTDQMRLLIAGFTFLTHDEEPPNRLEFIADGGKAYLRTPGAGVVRGQWTIRNSDDRSTVLICFKYPTNVAVPKLRKPDRDWACEPADPFRRRAEIVIGDAFDLGKAKAKPVELPRKRVNLGTLLKAMPLPFAR